VNAARKMIKDIQVVLKFPAAQPANEKGLEYCSAQHGEQCGKIGPPDWHQLRIRLEYYTISMKLPTYYCPNNGILALAWLFQYCNMGEKNCMITGQQYFLVFLCFS
jgi:hypothetical protein